MSDRLPTNTSSAKPGRTFGLGSACAALSAAVVVVWLIDSVATTHFSGRSTWEVSAVAAGICWTGAMVSLVLLHVLRIRGAPMAGALLGMLVRMTIPLIIVAVATMQGGELAEAGLAGQLVAFYLITLAIETCLSVALMKSAQRNVSVGSGVSEGSPSHG